MNVARVWLLGVATALWGCGHIGANLNRVSSVQSAAIIGFTGTVDLSDENSSGTVSGGLASIQGIQDINSPEVAARRLKEAEGAYYAVATRLHGKLNWTVLAQEAVTQNPVMQKIFRAKMGDRRVNAGYRFGIPNILWAELADLPIAEQKELKTALGVDALLVANVRIVSGRTYGYGVNGNGTFDVFPKAIIAFTAYDATPEPFWREPYNEGPPTQGKVQRNMGIVAPENEPNVVIEATQLATDVLLQKLDAARGAAANP
jgi:hypothetical protein